jgi:CNT family concentrative nucleoside transporter
MPPTLDSIHGTPAQRLQCLLGLLVFIVIAYVIGRLRPQRDETDAKVARTPFPWRVVIWGVVLQFVFAGIVLWLPGLLQRVNEVVNALLGFTRAGAEMVFGNLATDLGAPVFANPADKEPVGYARIGAIFAFFILPTIVFFSMLTAIAYHSGIMQIVVQALAWVMSRTMKTSGAETLSAAANIFVGQTEAPLLVRPFLQLATRSELMCVMVAGFANIASGVLGLYTMWLQDYVANVGGHLAAACFVSAPGAIVVSKLLVPEITTPQTAGGVSFKIQRVDANVIDAATRGTAEGVTLAINVGAMLIAFTALVALINAFIGWLTVKTGIAPIDNPLTLQRIFGYALAPFAWLAGVSWHDSHNVGSLLGVKTVLNELIAYNEMQKSFAKNPDFLSPRSALIATYALCGFANFASIGIQVGGIGLMAPDRRSELSRLGLLAMFGGGLASLMTAAVIGVLI